MKRNWFVLVVLVSVLTLIMSSAIPVQAGGPGNGGGNGNGQGNNGGGNGNGGNNGNGGGSGSDPDNNGNGPDRDFDTNGPDKAANGGDNNNGIGNDADCGDDAENAKLNPACVKKQTPTPTTTPTPCPNCPTPTPPCFTPTPTPATPTATPTPEGCGRNIVFVFLREVLEVYPIDVIPNRPYGWIADFPPGMFAGMTIGCHDQIALFWWTEQGGWTKIGTLTTHGPGGTIYINLNKIFSYEYDNYKFEAAQ